MARLSVNLSSWPLVIRRTPRSFRAIFIDSAISTTTCADHQLRLVPVALTVATRVASLQCHLRLQLSRDLFQQTHPTISNARSAQTHLCSPSSFLFHATSTSSASCPSSNEALIAASSRAMPDLRSVMDSGARDPAGGGVLHNIIAP